jgi:N-methylhydantoinase A
LSLGHRIASDIGGTFTDIAYIDDDGRLVTGKLPSTPANYADGVVRGIVELLRRQGVAFRRIEQVLHGCTVATNAILEHKGARTALVTTAGFRDVLELRRIRVPRLYEPLYVKPAPLVPRRWRLEVDERMGPDGAAVRALDEGTVGLAIDALRAAGVEAVAVCLLHSYANPAHERRIGDLLAAALPGVFVSLSVDVLPEIREYERTSTTVINAYVGPPVKRYLDAMAAELKDAGLAPRLFVMQSSGGIIDARTATQRPAQIVECGPAAGVIGAQEAGRRAGYDNLITFDMGGTTAKAAIIEEGRLLHADCIEVGGGLSASNALGGGGGYTLKLPAIDISEVGAGGGSLVRLDKAGAMKVGPESAGAVPGPACYGLGGEQPTVTDANVVLGFLNPEALAGGTVPIQARRSHDAIAERIARPLGREVLETAFGIHTVANATMMRAVKAVTTYRGRDPRQFALFAFGGNGGVHAVDLARVLQIGRVIVPPAAGVFSALGLLNARQELNLSRACLHLARGLAPERAEADFAELAAAIARHLDRPRTAIEFERQADMRYRGQAFELTIPLPEGPLDPVRIEELSASFEVEHERRYGHRFAGEYPVEVVNLRLVGRVREARELAASLMPAEARAEGRREVYFGPHFGAPVETPVVGRADIGEAPRSGPLIVEEYDCTTVVPPDCEIRRDAHDNLLIGLPPAA